MRRERWGARSADCRPIGIEYPLQPGGVDRVCRPADATGQGGVAPAGCEQGAA